MHAFADATGYADNHFHRDIGGIIGEDTGRIGDHDLARGGALEVDMLGSGTEIGDQPHVRPGSLNHGSVDAVGHSGNEHVATLHSGDKLFAG